MATIRGRVLGMDKQRLSRRISVAAKREPADLVIKNGRIIDVFNGEITTGDIAIVDGYFAGIGHYTGKTVIDAKNRYVCPAFIDGHVHIESSMLTPKEFAKVLLVHGVTTAVTDPHEIANVAGTAGIQYMLDTAENLPFDFYFMLPSCVPATEFEHAGACLTIEELRPFLTNPKVLGLAEVMNYPAVFQAEDSMIDKLVETKKRGKVIDGHGAGLKADELNVFMSAGITSDHECTIAVEAKERLRKGMYLMIREGTVAKDLRQLIEVVTEGNSRRCLFVTDDKHLDDLLDEGSIDHNVRLAISSGIPPITAIQMATINSAECFGLEGKGAIAPGYKADFLLLDSLNKIEIAQVFQNGKKVVENSKLVNYVEGLLSPTPEPLKNTVRFHELSETALQIQLKNNPANIIEIIPNSLITKHIIENVNLDGNGIFQASVSQDYLKLAVVERHHMTKQIGLGIVKGLGLKKGAIATTIAHDSHNLIIAGTSDADMLFAAIKLKEMQGGLIVVSDRKVIGALSLPIAGLMTDRPFQEVNGELTLLNHALRTIGAPNHFNPFLTLSFLALPVIPELKLTDSGLFQVSTFKHIEIDSI